jgi:hypothetical protein
MGGHYGRAAIPQEGCFCGSHWPSNRYSSASLTDSAGSGSGRSTASCSISFPPPSNRFGPINFADQSAALSTGAGAGFFSASTGTITISRKAGTRAASAMPPMSSIRIFISRADGVPLLGSPRFQR